MAKTPIPVKITATKVTRVELSPAQVKDILRDWVIQKLDLNSVDYPPDSICVNVYSDDDNYIVSGEITVTEAL